MNGFADAEQIVLMGIALAIGLLIGVERGWKFREAKEEERIAGLRTYGLTGLLGGGAGLLSQYIGTTAEEVLNQIDCCVLVLKPEAFVTLE